MSEDFIITISDARNYTDRGGCKNGFQLFLESHGFNFRSVVRHGIKASELLATGDVRAIALVNKVRENG